MHCWSNVHLRQRSTVHRLATTTSSLAVPAPALQHEVEDVAAFVAAACRRLKGLQRLRLMGAQHLEEVVFEQLAGKGGGCYYKESICCRAEEAAVTRGRPPRRVGVPGESVLGGGGGPEN